MFDRRARWWLVLLLMGWPYLVCADPVVLGIGAMRCQDFLETERVAGRGEVSAVARRIRYRSWLAGFASGLSLASGEDVLRGVPLEGVLRQLRYRCEKHPGRAIAEAATGLLAGISRLPPLMERD